MALINKLTAIGDAIRSKTGGSSPLSLTEMASSISALAVPNNTVVYNQMNTQVGKFITEVTYDPSDYSYSNLSNYVVPTDYDKSKPFGATITIPASGTLTLTDSDKSFSYSVSSGSHTIHNITPGAVGSYIVKNSNDQVICAGLLKPTGSLRMIYPIGSTPNVRDLGGWGCDGGTVKYGKLFRGGVVYIHDAKLFHDLLGIRAELDLRWNGEAAVTSVIGTDVEFKHISGPWCTIGTSGNWDKDAHKKIIEYIIDTVIAGKPLYFHCAAGADRTGTVAFLIESLLGVSQSDTDKDYELTSFMTGIDTDANARRRDEDEWKNYMAEFSAYQGNTMRDKVINWAETIGITIEKINAFRAAMIDGTPAVLQSTVGTSSITKNFTGVTGDNSASTSVRYQPYVINLLPQDGKVISSVSVMMGGADITDSVFSGKKAVFRHGISYSLTNCTLSTPLRRAVIDKECFCCEIAPDTGYTFEGATVSITMGGTDVSSYFDDGKITIPKVTGNIVITVSAEPSAPAYINQIKTSVTEINGSTVYNNGTGYKDGYRYKSDATEGAQSGCFTTGYIHIQQNDIVRLYGDIFGVGHGSYCHFYKGSDGTKQLTTSPNDFKDGRYSSIGGITSRMGDIDYDLTNNQLRSFKWIANYDVWAKFTFGDSFIDGVTVLTINEEM